MMSGRRGREREKRNRCPVFLSSSFSPPLGLSAFLFLFFKARRDRLATITSQQKERDREWARAARALFDEREASSLSRERERERERGREQKKPIFNLSFLTLISRRMLGRMILGRGLLISLIATRSPVALVLRGWWREEGERERDEERERERG